MRYSLEGGYFIRFMLALVRPFAKFITSSFVCRGCATARVTRTHARLRRTWRVGGECAKIVCIRVSLVGAAHINNDSRV